MLAIPAVPVALAVPLFSIPARGVSVAPDVLSEVVGIERDWYMLRYRVASEFVELFMHSRVDALALASVIRVTWSVPCQVWVLASSGREFLSVEGVYDGEIP